MRAESKVSRVILTKRRALALTMATALVGCGDPQMSATTQPDGGTAASGALTLEVQALMPGEPITAGRLAVVWFQLNDDGPDPALEVGYDVPFAGDATRIEIPIAAVRPPGEANLFCTRMCNDEAMCPCMGEPRVGVAYVVVVADSNGNGRADVAFRTASDFIYGVGQVVMGYSASAYTAAPPPFDRAFPAGIARGVAPYALVRPGDPSMRPHIGAPDRAAVYPLSMCSGPVRGCAVGVPNLF